MSARQLARKSNEFIASPDSVLLDSLRTTREVAALLGLEPSSVRARAASLRVRAIVRGGICYWTPSQVERLRGRE